MRTYVTVPYQVNLYPKSRSCSVTWVTLGKGIEGDAPGSVEAESGGGRGNASVGEV